MNSFQFAASRGRIKGNPEVLEEPVHSQETSKGQLLFERGFDDERAGRYIEHHIMQSSIFGAGYAGCGFLRTTGEIDSQVSGEISMEEAPGCARVDDHFEAFSARCLGVGQGDLYIQRRAVCLPAKSIGEDFVGDSERFQVVLNGQRRPPCWRFDDEWV